MLYALAYVAASVLHELAHLLAAMWFGVRIERAFLFADVGGRVLFRRRRGKTVLGIGWWPLDSYVKLAGTGQFLHAIAGRKVTAPKDPGDIRCRSRWQRRSIFLAGVAVNLTLAAWCLHHYPDGYLRVFGWWNLAMGAWNLIPMRGLDGWYALKDNGAVAPTPIPQP